MPFPARQRFTPNRLRSFHVPAPVGGDDTVSPGSQIPPSRSILSVNLIGAELGLRSRLGWREWAILGTGEEVRSLLPYTGSTKDGASNRLFAVTQSGIWDVSASGDQVGHGTPPVQVVTFATQNDDSGWGTSTVFVTAAGHFLCYCDEANGYYTYSESGAIWTKVVQAASTAWAPNTAYLAGAYVANRGLTYQCTTPGTSVGTPWAPGTAYALNDVVSVGGATYTCVIAGTSQGAAWVAGATYAIGVIVTNGGNSYVCTKAGTAAGSGGPTGTTGSAIVDNTVTWAYLPTAASGPAGTGSSIVDGAATWQHTPLGPTGTGVGIGDGTAGWSFVPSIAGVDPAHLAFACAWKNRLWFVERDTGRGWYLGLFAIYGTATSFTFGNRFQRGGDLRCLASWTFDGGSGIDDALVAVSGGGDVLVYKGTDPSTAGSFEMQGVWYAGAVPAGRRLTTDSGGDLLLMTSTGILPLSKLVTGNIIYDRSQYQTGAVSNLFNQMQAATSNLRGWAMRLHPQDSALMVLVPTAPNQASQQLVMSLITKGWHRYRDMPMGACAEPWGNTLYFGTPDGRVCVNDGYLDGLLLSDPNAYSTINWSLLTAYSNLGSPNRKRVQSIRVKILSQGGAIPVNAEARYGFDLSEAAPPPALAQGLPGAAWDVALWDQAQWGGSYQVQTQTFGAFGSGPEVALAIRGSASSRMTLVGADVAYDVGSWT